MAQFGGQKNPPWATQFTATAVSQPGQAPEHVRCKCVVRGGPYPNCVDLAYVYYGKIFANDAEAGGL
jgi:hypothetical protein